MSLRLIPVSTLDQVEWLRVQRSRPELYKYFRQDRPLSIDQQRNWWRTLNKNSVRLFIMHDSSGTPVGYVGFNPFSRRTLTAEFGIFVIPEFQNKGYATMAMKEILKRGFEEYGLSSIYSDVLDYPNENRFDFYEALGFEAYPPETQNKGYMKQGVYIHSIKFFMTREKYLQDKEKYGQDGNGGLEPVPQKTADAKARHRWKAR